MEIFRKQLEFKSSFSIRTFDAFFLSRKFDDSLLEASTFAALETLVGLVFPKI